MKMKIAAETIICSSSCQPLKMRRPRATGRIDINTHILPNPLVLNGKVLHDSTSKSRDQCLSNVDCIEITASAFTCIGDDQTKKPMSAPREQAPSAKAQAATQPEIRIGVVFKISAFLLLAATAGAVYYAEKHFVPTGHKVVFMAALFIFTVLLVMIGLPPFPQPLSYHLFADSRSFCCGVPNTMDVIVSFNRFESLGLDVSCWLVNTLCILFAIDISPTFRSSTLARWVYSCCCPSSAICWWPLWLSTRRLPKR